MYLVTKICFTRSLAMCKKNCENIFQLVCWDLEFTVTKNARGRLFQFVTEAMAQVFDSSLYLPWKLIHLLEKNSGETCGLSPVFLAVRTYWCFESFPATTLRSQTVDLAQRTQRQWVLLWHSAELPSLATFLLKYILGNKDTVIKSSLAKLPVVAVHGPCFLTFCTVFNSK